MGDPFIQFLEDLEEASATEMGVPLKTTFFESCAKLCALRALARSLGAEINREEIYYQSLLTENREDNLEFQNALEDQCCQISWLKYQLAQVNEKIDRAN
jgi:hypothetical protein